MVRRWFFWALSIILMVIAVLGWFRPGALWLLLALAPVALIGLRDAFQRKHTILRNFPVIGHLRYFMEMIRPEIQQYFIESNIDAYPVEREFRAIVYQRAKGELETRPFGTQRDLYKVGYEWASHSLAAHEPTAEPPRISIGGKRCAKPYNASILNVSAMSFGALSTKAVLALSGAARLGNFALNTGEGGISDYHLEGGGDLIWQIGTSYFGCRNRAGDFDAEAFRKNAANGAVKMIELKLSQGAKPGKGV